MKKILQPKWLTPLEWYSWSPLADVVYDACPELKNWEQITDGQDTFNLNSWLQRIWEMWERWDLTIRQKTDIIFWLVSHQTPADLRGAIMYAYIVSERNKNMKFILNYLWAPLWQYLDQIDAFANLLVQRWYLEASNRDFFAERLLWSSDFTIFLEILQKTKHAYEAVEKEGRINKQLEEIIENKIYIINRLHNDWMMSDLLHRSLIRCLSDYDVNWYNTELLRTKELYWQFGEHFLLQDLSWTTRAHYC